MGGTCAVGWRQFARWGDVDSTYLVCLAAGALAGALNLLRLMQDLPEMRVGSVLQRELSEGQFRTVTLLYWLTSTPNPTPNPAPNPTANPTLTLPLTYPLPYPLPYPYPYPYPSPSPYS